MTDEKKEQMIPLPEIPTCNEIIKKVLYAKTTCDKLLNTINKHIDNVTYILNRLDTN